MAGVVRGAIEQLGCDVLVVDDGSADATGRAARAAGAHVLTHPFNLGVGAAVRSGIRFAVDRGYHAVVQLDADGQHDPAEAVHLVERLGRSGPEAVDVVVGSRFAAGYDVGRCRRAVMRWLARSVRRRLGSPITDATSGFRAFGPRALDRYALSYPSEYLSDTVEALLLAAEAGLVVAEVPVRMRSRQGGQPSSGRMSSMFHLLRLGLIIPLHRVRRPVDGRGPSPYARSKRP